MTIPQGGHLRSAGRCLRCRGRRDVSHDPGSGHVERAVVLLHLVVSQVPTVRQRVELLIVGVGLVEKFFLLFPAHVLDLLDVACDRARGVHAVPPVRERRVSNQPDAAEEHKGEEHNHDVEPYAAFLLRLCAHRGAARRFLYGAGGRRNGGGIGTAVSLRRQTG